MKCPRCGSEKVIKAGKLRNKYTTKRGYRCNGCKRYFVERDGFENKSYPKRVIVQALHLYVEGLSLSKIRDFFWQHYGYGPADSTMLGWMREYSKLLNRLERRRKPKVRGRIRVDEAVLKVCGKRRYSINAVDSVTGYNLQAEFVERRNADAYKLYFRALMRRIGGQARAVFRRGETQAKARARAGHLCQRRVASDKARLQALLPPHCHAGARRSHRLQAPRLQAQQPDRAPQQRHQAEMQGDAPPQELRLGGGFPETAGLRLQLRQARRGGDARGASRDIAWARQRQARRPRSD
ncbi:MAG: hypothetical protein AB1894_30080 [Chloroflexota bacterium]